MGSGLFSAFPTIYDKIHIFLRIERIDKRIPAWYNEEKMLRLKPISLIGGERLPITQGCDVYE